MAVIKLVTEIKAAKESCFDLSRSIDLHVLSTQHTGEKAIAGCTSGLIALNETVTWRARHFGIWLTLTSKITDFQFPHFFVDEMVSGPFKSFRHEHHFKSGGGATIMTDIFKFESPLGRLGKLANALILQKYMQQLLRKRNEVIKDFAESDKGPEFLLATGSAFYH
jgi:ligand-binding SRPBCC domain-containing protein